MNDQAKFFWENRPVDATRALHDVMDERHRQMMVEGWTAKHDDEHRGGAMAVAAACYAIAAEPVMQLGKVDLDALWRWTGWARKWWKPKDKRRNLIRAAALLLAEIERMDRAAAKARVSAAPAPSEREQFEEALRRKPDALGWNLTDAMFWAWCAARNARVAETPGTWEHRCSNRPPSAPNTVLPQFDNCPTCGAAPYAHGVGGTDGR